VVRVPPDSPPHVAHFPPLELPVLTWGFPVVSKTPWGGPHTCNVAQAWWNRAVVAATGSPGPGGHVGMRGSVRLRAVTELHALDPRQPPQAWPMAHQAVAGVVLGRSGPSTQRWRALAKGFLTRRSPFKSTKWRLSSRAGSHLSKAWPGQRHCQVWAEATHVPPSVPRGTNELVEHVGSHANPHTQGGALPAH